MANNSFFLDEEDDEELENSGYFGDEDDEEEEEDESSEIGEDIKEEKKQKSRAEREKELYGGRLTADEIWLSAAYDSIVKAAKKNEKKDGSILDDVVTTLVMANPKHTSKNTAANVVKEALQKQGHSRMVATLYTPETRLRAEDIDIELNDEDDSGFNEKYAKEAKDRIAAFVEYLSTRDLSKDSTVSRRRKLRQLPAFIIFLFTSGMYDLIINCPTMPPEYDKQINRAMETIMKEKYSIVDELARKYEEAGRDKVAERVREMGLSWFAKEPNQIRTASQYSDLELTQDDVDIYREYRPKFNNAGKAITQEFISDLIEVLIDPAAATYEKLKDKTRADAIADVKEVFSQWSKDNAGDSELATQVIWGDLDFSK